MNYGKIDRYILIAILACVLIALYFLYANKKDTGDQNNLLMAMAEKLRVSNPNPDTSEIEQQLKQKIEQTNQKTQADEDQIIIIADKLCFGHPLDDAEKQFQKKFSKDINKELESSKKVLAAILNKFLSGSTEFDEFEKEYYEANQPEIDSIVQNRKLFASIIKKLTDGITEFTDAELEFQQNYPAAIEQELTRIKKEKEKFAGANPPMAAGERLKIILSLFEDGIPKNNGQIAKLYAEKTSKPVNTGNMSTVLGKLNKDHNLTSIKIAGIVYHGLPEWFDGNKLKPEYKQKIAA